MIKLGVTNMIWIILGIVVVIVIAAAMFSNENNSPLIARDKNKERIESYLNQIKEFNFDKKYFSYDKLQGIAVDYGNGKLMIFNSDANKNLFHKTYNFNDLVESEIIEDGVTITKTSRASQFAGAAIGGTLAGGVGMVVGGLSGKKTNDDEIRSMDLKLLFNDLEKPVHVINYLTPLHRKTQPKNTQEYKEALEKIRDWHGVMKVIIERSN